MALLIAAAAPLATGQTVLRDGPSHASAANVSSILPGSPAVEGRPFVLDLRGDPSSRAMVALRGPDVGVALAHVTDPVYLKQGVWGVPITFDSEGRASITLDGWKAGSELTLCAIGMDPLGRLAGMSASLSVRPVPVPVPVVAARGPRPHSLGGRGSHGGGGGGGSPTGPSVSPTSAGVGQPITISGPEMAAFVGYAPEDLRVINDAVSGCLARGTAVGANSLTAAITSGSPFPQAAQLQVQGGAGAFSSVPPFGGMTYTNPAWGWYAGPGAPIVNTGTTFETTALSVFQPCSDPDMFVDLPFRLENGILKVTLPGTKACKGDKFSYDIGFTLSDGSKVATSHVGSSGLTSANGWASDSLFVQFPLTIGLLSTGCAVTFSPSPTELWITAPSPKTITSFSASSHLHIEFSASENVIVIETHGVNDSYSTANGAELTTPDPDFDYWVLHGGYGIPARREYDMAVCDRYLRDTFSNYGPGAFGEVRSGNVQLHINGFACQTYTDGIALGWTPTPAFAWGVALPRLEILNFGWHPGDDATLCFDLAKLPVIDGANRVVEVRNILQRVNEDHLDIAVQDDTTVDYITVKVLRRKDP